MARVLITGGAGFIGSHLCESFLKQGHEVICIDNYSTGAQENISSLVSTPRFRFLDHNVTRFIDIGGSLNYVLHFASPASPVDYLELPIPTLEGWVSRHAQRPRPGESQKGRVSPRLDVGGVRRSFSAPAK